MKLKLDENLDVRLAQRLQKAGHEAVTVHDQKLHGVPDTSLFEHCIAEGHALISLDKDFSNVLRFPPEKTPGLVVLRGHNNLLSTMQALIQTLIEALAQDQPIGKLWIIEPGRLRIHETVEEGRSEA